MKVTWNGGPYDPETIEAYGVVFTKGKAANVPDDHEAARKLEGNPHFEVSGKKSKDDVQPSDGGTVEGKHPEQGSRIDDPVRVPDFAVQHVGAGKYALVGKDGSKSDLMTKAEAEKALEAVQAAQGDGD